jgi:hypothetical protein
MEADAKHLFETMIGIERGVKYLTGDNLKVVWAKFSMLSYAVLPNSSKCAWHTFSHF